ncbi:PEGA domain-containing protein [Hymenobacter gummosus]|uniref:PEGA domain-containing protein n=1 Tax=Hymenobacter gummosus TaxID=1776032 RepID=A0A431TVG4_9BACT|nr:PEGA domain-containing protein [Hymenobacter gummosus]RTQ45327.1 PEGA domain-containing protein [Hymenobacter gummosus]
MRKFATPLLLLLTGSTLLSSCASTTVIQSNPGGARVFLNDEPVRVTPYRHTDTEIVGTTTTVRLEKEGYETLNTSFSRDEEVDVGAIIGGIFVTVPFLWVMKYKPTHSYELKPAAGTVPRDSAVAPAAATAAPVAGPKSRAERLREAKQLLDEKILTQAEYEKEKQRILAEKE